MTQLVRDLKHLRLCCRMTPSRGFWLKRNCCWRSCPRFFFSYSYCWPPRCSQPYWNCWTVKVVKIDTTCIFLVLWKLKCWQLVLLALLSTAVKLNCGRVNGFPHSFISWRFQSSPCDSKGTKRRFAWPCYEDSIEGKGKYARFFLLVNTFRRGDLIGQKITLADEWRNWWPWTTSQSFW